MDDNANVRSTSRSWLRVTLAIAGAVAAAVAFGALVAAVTGVIWFGLGAGALVAVICAAWGWRTYRAGGDQGTLVAQDERVEDAQGTFRRSQINGGGGGFS